MLLSRIRRSLLSLIVVAAFLQVPSVAHAQSPSVTDQALAQALFNQGKQLMSQGKYAQACAKFAASNRTAPGTGTLLNLAVCHVKMGKLASAWVEFSNAADADRRAGNDKRLAYSMKQMQALTPKLAHITISAPKGAPIPGLGVKLDGAAIASAALGVPAPVDPGSHTVEASAPGYKSWTKQVKIARNGDNQSVTIPRLVAASEAAVTQQPGAKATAGQQKPTPVHPGPPSATNGRRIAAYVTGGVGVVGIALGSVFGLKAFSDWKTRNDNCPGGRCNQAAVTAHDSAHTAALVSDVGFGVGIAALGAATYLFLTSSPHSSESPPHDSARWRVMPLVGRQSGGIGLAKKF